MPSRLLIDGYNLLYASNVFASSAGPPTLERTRTAFLQFLRDHLHVRWLRRTTVIFDATHAPPGLPQASVFADMQILFSRNPNDADAMIEDLLEIDRAPRELLVVSSDHRVQRAARQRGAKFIDSEAWLRELRMNRCTSRMNNDTAKQSGDSVRMLSEVQDWLKEFSHVDSIQISGQVASEKEPLRNQLRSAPVDRLPANNACEDALKVTKPKKSRHRQSPLADEKPTTFENPFPPGYGEDLK